MRRRDKIDVLTALVDQPLERGTKFFRGKFPAKILLGDHSVLAERATQRAAGEKHSAAAEAAGNDRLFPIVQRGPRGKNMVGHLTEATLPCGPVNTACTRTECAVTIIQHKLNSKVQTAFQYTAFPSFTQACSCAKIAGIQEVCI